MGQVCQMCGEERIDDDLERCPRCHQTLLVSEGLPPVPRKPRIPIPPAPNPKPVQEPQASPRPPQEKRHRRPRPQPGPPTPLAQRPHAPSVESSEFGRAVEGAVDFGAKHNNPDTPSREVLAPNLADRDFRPSAPPALSTPAAPQRVTTGPPAPPIWKPTSPADVGHIEPRPSPRPEPNAAAAGPKSGARRRAWVRPGKSPHRDDRGTQGPRHQEAQHSNPLLRDRAVQRSE